jgi:hypothetical protein
MLPIVLLAALQCDPAALQSKLAEANALIQQVKDDDAQVQTHRATIAQLEKSIAAERHNPSGVVSLRMLHDLGEDLQAERQWLADSLAAYKRDTAAANRALAQGEAIAKACKR